MIRVLIVDDHAVVRSGLRRLLDAEPDIETVGEAPNADRAVFEALEGKPDVVLLIDDAREGRHRRNARTATSGTGGSVLVLSMQDDRATFGPLSRPVRGYVLKEAADTEVVAAIRAVSAGERYVHPALGAKLVAADAEEDAGPSRTHSPSASARFSDCWPSATPTKRSRRSSSSRSGQPRRIALTSCRS